MFDIVARPPGEQAMVLRGCDSSGVAAAGICLSRPTPSPTPRRAWH